MFGAAYGQPSTASHQAFSPSFELISPSMSRLVRKRGEDAEIPQDMLRDIMSWLPGKSLVRFNSVSKHWSYSLTLTAFLLHHSRSPAAGGSPNSYYAFCFSDDEPRPPSRILQLFSFQVHSDELLTNNDLRAGVFASMSNFCDGLVCLFNFLDGSQNLPVLLCSSRIQDFSALPSSSLCLPPVHGSHVLRFHKCLLGFDPTRGAYRVLRSINKREGTRDYNALEYEILTIGSNKSWKPIHKANVPISIRKQGSTLPCNGCFCLNGVIYWLHKNDYHDVCLASVDLATEELRAFHVNQLNTRLCHINNRYFLAPVNGRPTLLVADFSCNNGWELTFLDHHDSNPVCQRRIFHSPVRSIQSTDYPQTSGTVIQKRIGSSKYYCYDAEKDVAWVIDVKGWEVLKIG